jgi:hypothetical protein
MSIESEMSMRLRDLRRAAVLLLCIGAALAPGACADTATGNLPAPQDARVQTARQLCTDLGYKAGTTEFAQCAQAEYDRLPIAASPQPAQADGWFERWIRKPPVCAQRACTTY